MQKRVCLYRPLALSALCSSMLIFSACGDEEDPPVADAGTIVNPDATTSPDATGFPDATLPDASDEEDAGIRADGGDASTNPDPQTVIFLHTNDEHSHELGFGPEIDDFPVQAAPTNEDIVGGIKRRAQVLVDLRNEATNLGLQTISVSAGDIMMGSLFHIGNAIGGIDYAILGAGLQYDIATIGNHEFDFGVGTLVNALSRGGINLTGQPGIVRMPIVASNIRFSMSSPADDGLAALYSTAGMTGRPVRRYHVAEYNGVTIGFIGVMGLDAALVAPFKSPVKFSLATTVTPCTSDAECSGTVCLPPATDPTATSGRCAVPQSEADAATHFPALVADIAASVQELRDMGVDMVVAVSHAGVDERELATLAAMGMGPENAVRSEEILLARGVDQMIGTAVKGIDVIIGGHSHTPLAAPLSIPNPNSGINTTIVQAGEYGKFVGKLRLDRAGPDAPWVIDAEYSNLVPVDAAVVADRLPALMETVLDTILTQVIVGLEGTVISVANDSLIYPGEQCDGTFLPNTGLCANLVPNAIGGTLSCLPNRQLDLSACTFPAATCGNGVRDGDEMCDAADSLETCESLGYESGALGCNANCTWSFGTCVSHFPSLVEVAVNFGDLGFPVKNDPAVAGDLFFHILGSTTFDVPKPVPHRESNLMNLATDAARYTLNNFDTQSVQDPVRVAINANGVLRDEIREGQTGRLSLSDLFRVLPLGVSPVENTPGYPLIDFYAAPAELKGALEVGVSQGLVSDSFWLGVSGARVEFDPTRAVGDRITKLELLGTKRDPWDDAGADELVYDVNAGGFTNPASLIHIASNLYIGLFAEALGICPRFPSGAQVEECKACTSNTDCTVANTTCNGTRCVGGNPAPFRVRSLAPVGRFGGLFQEIKEFLALTRYVKDLPNSGALPDAYNGAVPRRMCCVGNACEADQICAD